MADIEYRNIGLHAVSLASGTPLAPGDTGIPDLKDLHDKALVDDGALVPVETATDYTRLPAGQLQALAEGAGLQVTGSGKDGNVLAADYAKALTANDQKKEVA